MATFDLTNPDTAAGDALDGEEDVGGGTWDSKINTAYPFGQYFEVGQFSGTQRNGGVKFDSITVPQGATINSATITLGYEANSSSQTLTIYGDDVDSAAAWSNSSRPSSGFTNTTASATPTSPTSGPTFDITVTSIVQELVDRAGWVSGNNMRFSIIGTNTAYVWVRFEDVDVATGDTGQRPRIFIDYTAAGGADEAPSTGSLTLLGVGL